MADVAARREARRRKILENSKNRLKLITGENTELNNGVDHVIVNNDSTLIHNRHNNEIETFLASATKSPQENQTNNEFGSLLGVGVENIAILNENATETSTSSNNNSNINNDIRSWPLVLYATYSKKIFVVLLAIIIRLLFIFQMQFCVRDSIIYPFIIFEITLQYVTKDSVENVSPLMGTALLLSNLPSVQINRLLRTLKIFETFIQDFSLYFFTFFTVHLCLGAII